MDRNRCDWSVNDSVMMDYHDKEWGVPVRDDNRLFEFLVLDGFQAGISWSIVLNKREAFRKAYDHFFIDSVAAFSGERLELLYVNQDIIRNRRKIDAAVHNARIVQVIQKEYGSFSDYLWHWVGGKTIINSWKASSEIPAISRESQRMSDDMKKQGMKFVGPTICYAFMQSVGMVNDHLITCFRYHEVMDR